MFDSGQSEEELREALLQQSPETLVDIILGLRRELLAAHQKIERLTARVDELERELKEARPDGRRTSLRSSSPKKGGRKPGHPPSWRAVPQQIDEVVEAPLSCCPDCGQSGLTGAKAMEQYVEDVPEIRKKVTKIITYSAYCPHCRKRVRSRHPLQQSGAMGAAGAHIGASLLCLAHWMHYGLHIPFRQVRAMLEKMYSVRVTPSALVQRAESLGRKAKPHYEELLGKARGSPHVHMDETSWKIDGRRTSLWVVCHKGFTLYRVDARSREAFFRLLGKDYQGVLVSDCYAVYDGVCPRQHKCYAHHMKALSRALEKHPESACLLGWKAVFRAAMVLKEAWAELTSEKREGMRASLEKSIKVLLAEKDLLCEELAFHNRIAKQKDHLLVFLDEEGVEATNNLAERQLRPAVIARKLSCGNKTRKGADTWQTLASLLATYQQTGQDFLTNLLPLAKPALTR